MPKWFLFNNICEQILKSIIWECIDVTTGKIIYPKGQAIHIIDEKVPKGTDIFSILYKYQVEVHHKPKPHVEINDFYIGTLTLGKTRRRTIIY